MKCHEVDQSLTAYLHGEVGRSERELIRAHIARCERCQRELARLSEMQAQMSRSLHAAADKATPSLHAWARLQASLAPRHEPSVVDRVKQAFVFGWLGGSALPRNFLFFASGLLISGAILVWIAWGNPARIGNPRTFPESQPALPNMTNGSSQLQDRRMSGPPDEVVGALRAVNVNVNVGRPPANANRMSPLDPDIDRSVGGGWLFLQGPAEESMPFKICANCAQLQ